MTDTNKHTANGDDDNDDSGDDDISGLINARALGDTETQILVPLANDQDSNKDTDSIVKGNTKVKAIKPKRDQDSNKDESTNSSQTCVVLPSLAAGSYTPIIATQAIHTISAYISNNNNQLQQKVIPSAFSTESLAMIGSSSFLAYSLVYYAKKQDRKTNNDSSQIKLKIQPQMQARNQEKIQAPILKADKVKNKEVRRVKESRTQIQMNKEKQQMRNNKEMHREREARREKEQKNTTSLTTLLQ